MKRVIEPATNIEFFNQNVKLFSNAKVRKAFLYLLTEKRFQKLYLKMTLHQPMGLCHLHYK